jgi:hypothetical protein
MVDLTSYSLFTRIEAYEAKKRRQEGQKRKGRRREKADK